MNLSDHPGSASWSPSMVSASSGPVPHRGISGGGVPRFPVAPPKPRDDARASTSNVKAGHCRKACTGAPPHTSLPSVFAGLPVPLLARQHPSRHSFSKPRSTGALSGLRPNAPTESSSSQRARNGSTIPTDQALGHGASARHRTRTKRSIQAIRGSR